MTSMKTAIHEAGHARVTMHFGFDSEVSIEADPVSAGRTGMALTIRPDPTPESRAAIAAVASLSSEEKTRLLDEYLMWLAVIALSGPAAERLLAPDADEAEVFATSDADEDRASALVWDRSDSPRRLQANLARARAEARALVRRYSAEIVLIAAALAEKGHLGVHDLREIVERQVQTVA